MPKWNKKSWWDEHSERRNTDEAKQKQRHPRHPRRAATTKSWSSTKTIPSGSYATRVTMVPYTGTSPVPSQAKTYVWQIDEKPGALAQDEPYAAAANETAKALLTDYRDEKLFEERYAKAKEMDIRHTDFLRSGVTDDDPSSEVVRVERHMLW